MKYVIIGNGVAGMTAAETIRRFDPEGEITMIGDETGPPYCRPMISLVLEGAIKADKLPIRPPRFYEERNIRPLLGNRVTRIDVKRRSVTTAGGESIDYDKLLIASGADPRPIKAEGLELGNISYMRTQGHVRTMLAGLNGTRKALVLGGGLVGFKAAYGLLRRGMNVTMLIRSGYPLSMQVDEVAGQMVRDELIGRGLDVRVNIEVVGFEGNGQVREAILSDGSRLSCDMVVIGKGVLPAHSFVPRDKINVDLGIVVNGYMETSCPGVYAAGDVAEYVDVARKTPWVNAIWPEAVTQGRIAGMNMAARKVFYPGSLSRNVIRVFDMDIMTGGVVNPPPDALYKSAVFKDPKKKLYRKLVFQGEHLVGMAMVNRIEQGGVLLSAIQSRTPIRVPRENLLETGFNYSRLIWRAAARS